MFHGWHHLGAEGERIVEEAVIQNTAPAGPFHLELQPTNLCNAKCVFCCTTHFRHNEHLEWPNLERVINDEATRNLRFVRLIGGGEPTLYPQFGALLKTISSAGVKGCDLTTNGIVLERFAEQLAEAHCESVHVSLNEPTADLYARTMRTLPSSFDRVVAGVRKVAAVRDGGAPWMRLTVQFFVNAANWKEVPRMYDLGREWDADFIDIRTTFDPASGAHTDPVLPEDEAALGESMARIIALDAQLPRPRLRVTLLGHPALNHRMNELVASGLAAGDERLQSFQPSTPRREYCYMPWYSAAIAATGRVFSCCMHTELPGKCLGEVGTEGFGPIWHGAKFHEYRTQMREVMLLRGKMKYSPKRHGCLSGKCTENFGCNITFQLASDGFYDRLAARMEDDFGTMERARSRARDIAIRAAHVGRAVERRVRPQPTEKAGSCAS